MFYLSSLREQQGMIRELAVLTPGQPKVAGLFTAVMSFSFALTLVVAVPVSAVAYVLYTGPMGRPEIFEPAMLLMAGYILFQNTSWNLEMLLAGFRAGRELFRVRLLQSASYVTFAVVAGLLSRTLWALSLAIVASHAVSAIGRVLTMPGYLPARCSRADLREGFRTLPSMIAFGAKMAPGSVGYGMSNEAATWALGISAPITAVGAYNRSWQLVQRLRDVNLRISEALFPTLVERSSNGDRKGFDRAVIDTGRLVLILMLLPAAAGGGAAVGIMQIFGPGFEAGAPALAILTLMPAVGALGQAMGHGLNARNRPLVTSMVAVAGGVATVTLTFVLAPAFGATGAALAYLIGYSVSTAVTFAIGRRQLEVKVRELWPVRSMIGVVLSYAGGFAAARLADRLIPWPGGLIVGLVAGCLTFVGLLLIVGGVQPRDRVRIADLVGRVKARRGPKSPDPSTSQGPSSAPEEQDADDGGAPIAPHRVNSTNGGGGRHRHRRGRGAVTEAALRQGKPRDI
jgi:O-antigen/teichoic acid export membrane protein